MNSLKMKFLLFLVVHLMVVVAARGQVGGKITGSVKDPSGSVVAAANVALTNTQTGAKLTALTGEDGVFAFPVLAVGQYQLEITSDGFQLYRKPGLVIDIGTSLVVDVSLQLEQQSQSVVVTESQAQVETTDTQLGQVLGNKKVTEIPLNGRSYTDLFGLQVGVTPITTSGAGNSTSGGGFGTVPAAGEANTGQFSINGQREDANGFYLNGASVEEGIGRQAGIIPNLDSIAEFRILTTNTDAEYGNYSGGLINVVTKSGGNAFHGSTFEFLRNTALDARSYFSSQRSIFQQNQYGGTLGGPIKRNKLFFFADYQGQHTKQGQDTGRVAVPSLANRGGDFSADQNSQGFNPLGFCGVQVDPTTKKTVENPCTVNGTYLASILTKQLGYTVQAGEPFYFSGPTISNPNAGPCMSTSTTTGCVFPKAQIPTSAFGNLPAAKMLQYIPSLNIGVNQFESSAQSLTIHDERMAGRIDWNTDKSGNFSFYYFYDKYNLDNPYPSGFGGATVPNPTGGSFDGISYGLDQLFVVSNTKTFGLTLVNEARFSGTRLNNNLGVPKGGVGTTLAQQGITSGARASCKERRNTRAWRRCTSTRLRREPNPSS